MSREREEEPKSQAFLKRKFNDHVRSDSPAKVAPPITVEDEEYKSEWRLRYEAAMQRISAEKRDGKEKSRNGEEDDQDGRAWEIWHGKKSGGGGGLRWNNIQGEKEEVKKMKRYRGNEVRFEELATIFVDGLYPMIDARWLRFIFKDFGRVMDAFVPSKKREGVKHRFGFIRYRRMSEAMDAIKGLNGMRRHGNVLKVKLADYTWKRNGNTGELAIKGKTIDKKIWAVKMEGRTYKEAVMNTGFKKKEHNKNLVNEESPQEGNNLRNESLVNEERRHTGNNLRKESKGSAISVNSMKKAWLGRCLIGRLPSVTAVEGIEEVLKGEGVLLEVKRIGGPHVLLICQDRDEAAAFMENEAGWLKNWFSEIDYWTPELKNEYRFAWLSCIGVPIHAWESSTFRCIAGLWGEFIDVDDNTRKEGSYDRGRMLISTQHTKMIRDSVTMKVDERYYEIMVMEEGTGGGGGCTGVCKRLGISAMKGVESQTENRSKVGIESPAMNRVEEEAVKKVIGNSSEEQEGDDRSSNIKEQLIQEEREYEEGSVSRNEVLESGMIQNDNYERQGIDAQAVYENSGNSLSFSESDVQGINKESMGREMGLDGSKNKMGLSNTTIVEHGDLAKTICRERKETSSDPISNGSVWSRTEDIGPMENEGMSSQRRKGRETDEDLGLENQRMSTRRRAKKKEKWWGRSMGTHE